MAKDLQMEVEQDSLDISSSAQQSCKKKRDMLTEANKPQPAW